MPEHRPVLARSLVEEDAADGNKSLGKELQKSRRKRQLPEEFRASLQMTDASATSLAGEALRLVAT